VRAATRLFLTVGVFLFTAALAHHFLGHPNQLAHPLILPRKAGVLLEVFSDPANHPSTLLGLGGLLLAVIGMVLRMTTQRRRRVR